MLTRFSLKIGAAVYGALALLYLVAALMTGHSAHAEPPVNLAPTEAGLDVWHALAMMVEHPGELAVVDVRSAELYDLYHPPSARSMPRASAAAVRQQSGASPYLLVVAETDAQAAELVGAMGAAPGHVHFLKGGAPEWYLNLELPAPLFSSKPPPHGYREAWLTVRSWLASPERAGAKDVRAAIATLATLGFSPDQLAGKKKAPAGGKKKIAGGCG